MITIAKDKTKLKNAFHKIFDSYDPFDPLDTNRFSIRAVIYPTDGYFLSKLQFHSLSKTLDVFGESTIIVSEVESHPYDPFIKDRHWVLSDLDYQEYDSLPLAVENAIYSESGNWGFLVSHEDHAILVCNNKFEEVYQKYYQSLKKDLKEFIKYWGEVKSQGTETSWLPKLVDTLTIKQS